MRGVFCCCFFLQQRANSGGLRCAASRSNWHQMERKQKNCATPLPCYSPCLVWQGKGSRCHNKSSTLLRQQQQHLADIVVQVVPNRYVACCRVGGSRRVGGWCTVAVPIVHILVLYLFASAASFSTVIFITDFGFVRERIVSEDST